MAADKMEYAHLHVKTNANAAGITSVAIDPVVMITLTRLNGMAPVQAKINELSLEYDELVKTASPAVKGVVRNKFVNMRLKETLEDRRVAV